jgi:integrase
MARGIEKLTTALIAKAVKGADKLHSDGGGLWLQVRGESGASWIFRYAREGRRRHVGLGPLHTVDLAHARDLAKQHRIALLEGRDPAGERAAFRRTAPARAAAEAAKGKTFAEFAEEYVTKREPEWAEKLIKAAVAAGKEPPKKGSANQWRQTLRDYVNPVIGNLLPSEIGIAEVERVLAPIWTSKNETARRVRSRIELILGAAMVKGLCPKGPNPAAWTGNLQHVLASPDKVAEVVPMRALPWPLVPEFVQALHNAKGDSARAVEVAMLAGARSNEIRGMKWEHLHGLDGPHPFWLLTGDLMKAAREHVVPLTPRAVAILQAQPRREGFAFVFGYRKTEDEPFAPLSENALLNCIKDRGFDSTMHGLRATFKTWCLECTDFPRELAELMLAHEVGDKVEAAYIRGSAVSRRRELAQAWECYCAGRKPKDKRVRAVSTEDRAHYLARAGASSNPEQRKAA